MVKARKWEETGRSVPSATLVQVRCILMCARRKVKDPCLREIQMFKVHELIKVSNQSITTVAGTCVTNQMVQKGDVADLIRSCSFEVDPGFTVGLRMSSWSEKKSSGRSVWSSGRGSSQSSILDVRGLIRYTAWSVCTVWSEE
ncbi:hypothetical protein IGI04_019386 [Brassica rapa subsp. trilocularis]|uniref:Uncharacterized protein n=1 Tax=Brassica rapa subsp. trilocularis TaxID=1813537 RepID=A0ABQ7MG27_BRACM|nr:hypothetical protein IGI04_019386 [Brassica rapa subsp. trilocularis]